MFRNRILQESGRSGWLAGWLHLAVLAAGCWVDPFLASAGKSAERAAAEARAAAEGVRVRDGGLDHIRRAMITPHPNAAQMQPGACSLYAAGKPGSAQTGYTCRTWDTGHMQACDGHGHGHEAGRQVQAGRGRHAGVQVYDTCMVHGRSRSPVPSDAQRLQRKSKPSAE